MAYTRQMVVNAVGNDEELRAVTVCREIIFGEDDAVAGWPTVNWAWRAPDSTDFKSKTAGTKERFFKKTGYQPNELVAFVRTLAGSSTFTQAETD